MRRISQRVGCALLSSVLISATYANIDHRPSSGQALWVVPGFEEPLVPMVQGSAPDRALLETVEAYARTPDNVAAFERYVAVHPESPWNAAILTNLGLVYYRTGYFSKAIDALERAWTGGRAATDDPAKALIDRAVGELLRMHARLGRAERVAELLEQVKGRAIVGSASEAVSGAAGGLWMMRNDPGLAYLCGPMALKSLAQTDAHTPPATVDALNAYRSGPKGVSLDEIGALAKKLGLPYRAVFRRGGAIPVPSLVHWKLDHYAAIVAERDGWYQIQDPTFGAELWLEGDAINAESSGYFLVRNELAADTFRDVSRGEASRIHGMGNTTLWSPNGPTNTCAPMCTYSFQPTLISLNLSDTPVGYAPPIGPSMYTTLSYSQRDTRPPALPTFFNFGPKWTSNWLAYVVDNPRAPAGTGVSRYLAGGGGYDYVGFNKETGAFTPETTDLSVLVRIAEPLRYERRLGDGSKEIYATSDGSTAFPRRFFLTERIDARGNRIAFDYDDRRRLTSITDATKRKTTFAYEHAANPLLVTSISDPFGRTAKVQYGSDGRLTQITDVIGITSSLTYDQAGFVTGLVTPYGITRFSYKEAGVNRSLEATDPLGFTERIEFRHGAPGIPTVERVWPKGMSVDSRYQQFRNTFYWDKVAFREGAGDYTKAHITHWFHQQAGVAARTIESIKPPLEQRIWFNNPGSVLSLTGTYDVPSAIGRVLDDGTSQVSRITYNDRGNVTSRTDAAGRTTAFSYAPNQIDVMAVAQKTAQNEYVTVAQYSYDTRHLPLSATDAAGETTRFAYNEAGQLLSVTDASGHRTRYEYDALGYLQRVINANDTLVAQFTYDEFGRVAKHTDSEGGVVSSEYDVLDRPVKVRYPDGTSDVYKWDRLDLASMTDRGGLTTTFEYDANRRATAIVDASKRRVQLAYYPNGALESVTDANGNKTTWLRDLQSRVTAKVHADGSKYAYTYEAASGRLKSSTDPKGQVRGASYTVDDRVKELTYGEARLPTPQVTFEYDTSFPRLAAMTDGNGKTQYTYVPVGRPGAMRLERQDGPFENDELSYGYDVLGRVKEQGVGQDRESWTYDSLGRVTLHESVLGTFATEYRGQTGFPLSVMEHDGKVGSRWAYDTIAGDLRPTSVRSLGVRGFAYEASGPYAIARIDEVMGPDGTETRKPWSFVHDSVGRLESAETPGGEAVRYTYDAVANLTSVRSPGGERSATYNALNQIETFDGIGFKHDENGNLVDDGARAYEWDAADRLVRIIYKDEPGSTRFVYDGLGNRVGRFEEEGDSAATETRYLICGGRPCQARSGSDVVTKRYYSEGEVDSAAGGARYYYSRDHLGSVRDVVDATTGERVDTFDYEPYGAAVGSGTSSVDQRFAGMRYHERSGLYLTPFRVYDPRTARWLSRDPSGEHSSNGLYAYADGAPVTKHDPSGLDAIIYFNDGRPPFQTRDGVQFYWAIRNAAANSISYIDVTGHGSPNWQGFNQDDKNDPNGIGLVNGRAVVQGVINGQVAQGDIGKALAGKLAKNPDVYLKGCNVASGQNSLAEELSAQVAARVTACKDYTTGFMGPPSTMCGYGSEPAEWQFIGGQGIKIPGRPTNEMLVPRFNRFFMTDFDSPIR